VRIVVSDRRRIPGLIAIGVTRGGKEIYATRTRVGRRQFRTSVPLRRKPTPNRLICIAAWYGTTLPKCDVGVEAESIVRIHPTAAAR
jgi:hypothetical protein